MKKVYQIPEVEVMQMEAIKLLEGTMSLNDESTENPLAREIIFDVDED